jgi:hypothetical protein
MNAQFTNQEKPTLFNVIAWMTLASGIVNLFWGLGLSLTGLLSIVGILCIPLLILPTILGVFEIIYAAKLMSNPPQAVQPSSTIAILEIVCILVGNIFSVVVGILALVFYNDQTVRDYFARLNGTPVPVVPTVLDEPASIPEPESIEPAPVVVEESTPIEEEQPPLSDEESPKI